MAIKADPGFSLKDDLFNPTTVGWLTRNIAAAYSDFKSEAYTLEVLAQFPKLELKARIDCMAQTLARYLPSDYHQALGVLHNALPPALDPSLTDDDFGSFIWAVPSEFVAQQGCTSQGLSASLSFLEAATQRFSVEFAIRPFLLAYSKATLAFIGRCAKHPNYHVRRQIF